MIQKEYIFFLGRNGGKENTGSNMCLPSAQSEKKDGEQTIHYNPSPHSLRDKKRNK